MRPFFLLAASLVLAVPVLAEPIRAPGGAAQPHGAQPVPIKPVLIDAVIFMAQQAHYVDSMNTAVELESLRNFAEGRGTTPHDVARAQAASYILSLIAHPESIERLKPSLERSLGRDEVIRLKESAHELRAIARKEGAVATALVDIQRRYNAPDQDLDAIADRLATLFDGWTERWSEPLRPVEGWEDSSRRHYTLERPGPQGGREVVVSETISIPSHLEHWGLTNAERHLARKADDETYRLYHKVVPVYPEYDDSGLWKGFWALAASVSGILAFAVAGLEEMSRSASLQLISFGIIAAGLPLIGRWLGRLPVASTERLRWGEDGTHVRALGLARTLLASRAAFLERLIKLARPLLYAVSALTAALVIAGGGLFRGLQGGAPMTGSQEVSLMLLRWGGVASAMLLAGLLAGLKLSRDFARASDERLRRSGVQRWGGI